MRRNKTRIGPRRHTLRVMDGRVQKKNRWDCYVKTYPHRAAGDDIAIVREQARRGFRHVVSTDDLRAFLGMIPDWERYSRGLDGVVLGDGEGGCFGWCDDGIVCINAWETEHGFEQVWDTKFYEEHRHIVDKLMVPCLDERPGETRCRFTRKSACAFQLLHVLLHELGHHVDRMSTRHKVACLQGEPFAESFANALADRMWTAYCRVFRL